MEKDVQIRKKYPINISREQFEKIRPALEDSRSVRNQCSYGKKLTAGFAEEVMSYE